MYLTCESHWYLSGWIPVGIGCAGVYLMHKTRKHPMVRWGIFIFLILFFCLHSYLSFQNSIVCF